MGIKEWLLGSDESKEIETDEQGQNIDITVGEETKELSNSFSNEKEEVEANLKVPSKGQRLLDLDLDDEFLVRSEWCATTGDLFFKQKTEIKIEGDTLIAVYDHKKPVKLPFMVSSFSLLVDVKAQEKLITTAFNLIPNLFKVIFSSYCQIVDQKGHLHRICYSSIKALREIAEGIITDDLDSAEILDNFDLRLGLDFSKEGEIIELHEVAPFEEEERAEREREEREKERIKEFNKNMSEKECKIHQSSEKVTNCDKCGKFLCIECGIIKDVDTKYTDPLWE